VNYAIDVVIVAVQVDAAPFVPSWLVALTDIIPEIGIPARFLRSCLAALAIGEAEMIGTQTTDVLVLQVVHVIDDRPDELAAAHRAPGAV
jgi:hypothetical protein